MSSGDSTVRDRALALDGLRLHYREWGSPRTSPVVLLHGATGNARHWDTLARALAHRHLVLALDQRGHGESDPSPGGLYTPDLIAGDFEAFVAALPLERLTAVGFSFGGHAAYTFAARHPDRVTRLVLVESTVPPDTPENRAHMAALRGLPEAFGTPDEAVGAFAAAGLAPHAPADELRHWVRSGLKQRADGRWAWRLDPVLRRPPPPGVSRLTQPEEVMWRLLAQVRCPTLIVRGETTIAFPLELAQRMADAMSDARVVTVPDAGHWTPLDNPTGFARVVQDFLADG